MSHQLQLMLQQAIQAFESGNLDSAEIILKRVLQVDSKNLPALHVYGFIKASQFNFREAADLWIRATRINPNDAFIHYNLAKALSDSGNDIKAIAHHKKAVELAPNNPETWLNYGKTVSNLGSHEIALDYYKKALNIDPNYVQANLNIGVSLHELKRYEEAITAFDKALSLKPDYAEAWSNKGATLNELKRYEEA
ncbi:tetratricopeptide repeat protein, partial [Polynucleobacter sp. AP-Feld-500C-C5]|uniref:tetratricopeptide repeat protein n=1 Tax=Polynucleobacter sp. AP-Feld-500C-C5 TaxID=2576924 RepID=UPI001C0D2DC5